jgi:hypothetical protein
LNWPATPRFPKAAPSTATSSWRRSAATAISTSRLGDLDRAPQDDESGWKFDAHVFKPGEYVSVTEQDGETRTFRVVKVA